MAGETATSNAEPKKEEQTNRTEGGGGQQQQQQDRSFERASHHQGSRFEGQSGRYDNGGQSRFENQGSRFNDGGMRFGGEGRGRGFGGGRGSGGGGRGGRPTGGGRGYRDKDGRPGPRTQEDRLHEKLQAISGPTHDLPPMEYVEKKFSGRCRLYVGNLTGDASEEEITELFKQYGETAEVFFNKEKNFAFIRLDYRANAEKAKRELDGSMRKGRALKVRYAPHSAAIKVKNLNVWVTNELLEKAFSIFGEIERVLVLTDDRGRSKGEGIVEYARKPGAQLALKKCDETSYFLTSSLRPVVVEPHDALEDEDGYQEKNLPKKSSEYIKEREVGPRFASVGSFEHEYGMRWKQLYEVKKQKEESLEREMRMDEEKLAAQMEFARYEHETEMLREQLRQRELDRERQKAEWDFRERQHEEARREEEERRLRQQEEMQKRIQNQEEEMRRRHQENSLFMQAHQLNSLLDQQEQALRTTTTTYEGQGTLPLDPKAFIDSYEQRGSARYETENREIRGSIEMRAGGPRGGNWGRGDRASMDDYPNKRRRY